MALTHLPSLVVGVLAGIFALVTANGDGLLEYRVEEEVPIGTNIGDVIKDLIRVSSLPSHSLDLLRFRFLTTPPPEKDLFTIGHISGVITTTARVDRDIICPRKETCLVNYDIAVTPNEFFQIVKVEIEIDDINDHAPRFPQNKITLRISESAVPDTSFPIPSPFDPDSGVNSIQSYGIFPKRKKFELTTRDTADGAVDLRIRLTHHLDHERETNYQFRVVAYDGGENPQSGSIQVEVEVQDANDNNPIFANSTYRVTIPENQPVGTSIIRVTANDDDVGLNGEIEYRFSDVTLQEWGHLFSLNSRTGEIFVRKQLDYEEGNIYVLSVSAQDRGPDSLPTQTSVEVSIEDLNDNAPHISVNSLTNDGVAQVAENAKVETFVAHISVIDKDQGDNKKFTCGIDSGQFILEKMFTTEYKLVTGAVFDYEVRSDYSVTLTCEDFGSPRRRAATPIIVRIIDENDHAPRFLRDFYKHMLQENNEPGATVMVVSAEDQDADSNGQILYSIDETVADYLHIDPLTGLITAKVSLDHEEIDELTFMVSASDNGEPQRTSQIGVTLTILDSDDQRPIFLNNSYHFTVEEERPADYKIGNVTAEDKDSSPYNSFFYGIHPESGSAKQAFTIDRDSGDIYTARLLDREQQAMYYLIVTASPENDPDFTSTATVTIDLVDINDNAPVFTFPGPTNDSMLISSMAPQGYVFSKIRAYDLDSDRNGRLTYSIYQGNELGRFRLDQQNGDLMIATDLSLIDKEDHMLVLKVHDAGSPQLSEIARLAVGIRADVPFVNEGEFSFLSGESLTIILAFALAAIVVALVIIVVIVVIVRNKHRSNVAKHNEKEKQLMLGGDGSKSGSHQDPVGLAKTPTPSSCVSPASEDALSHSSSKQNTRQSATERGKPNGYVKMDLRHKANGHQVISDDLPPPPSSWTEVTSVSSPMSPSPHGQNTAGSVRSNSSTTSLIRPSAADDFDCRASTTVCGNNHDVHSPIHERENGGQSPTQTTKPVVVFIRDQAETDIVTESDSAGSGHSNSDSGRGQSSEDGEPQHGRSSTMPHCGRSGPHSKHTHHHNGGLKLPNASDPVRRSRSPVLRPVPSKPSPTNVYADSAQIDLLRELHHAMKSPQPERHLMMTQTLDRASKNKTNPNLHVHFASNRAHDVHGNNPYTDIHQHGQQQLANSQSAYDMHTNRASINSGDYFMYDSVDSKV